MNTKHMSKLKNGVNDWNEWRLENSSIVPNLSGSNLIGADLSGSNLSGSNLSGSNLSGSDLSGANLYRADLYKAALCEATIDGVILSQNDIGGPGHILCALTNEEWSIIKKMR